MRPATSLDRLGTETAFEVLARAKKLEAQGRRVIHLEIGEPDAPTPPHIVEAGIRALRDGHTTYCPSAGLPELRHACADYMGSLRGISVDPDHVLIAPGAKPFIFFGILATCDPGDEVIYPDPGFPIYESVIRWAGAVPVPLPLREDHGFGFTKEDLASRLTPQTKLVIINSPGNPTGGVIAADALDGVADVLREHPCWILSDEVYAELLHDRDHETLTSRAGFLDRTILMDSFSKTFAMTGWRLGYAAVPPTLVEPITKLLVNSVSCTPPATQLAGLAALQGPREALDGMRETFRRRREVLVSGLNELPGVRCAMPEGAFYAFPNVSGTGYDADVLARALLEESGIALLSGSAFGAEGRGHWRLSYATSLEDIEAALEVMQRFLEARC